MLAKLCIAAPHWHASNEDNLGANLQSHVIVVVITWALLHSEAVSPCRMDTAAVPPSKPWISGHT